MSLTKLTRSLSKFGAVEIIKEGEVFTLLMTGKKLDSMDSFIGIQKLVTDYTKDKYPTIEAMKNEDTFYCIILKK